MAPTAADLEAPDDLRSLNLTDLQRRVLEQVFHRHVFETPAAAVADADFSVALEPTATGGLCRMGTGGDLPVRMTVKLKAGPVAPVHLRYYAEDFYGRKVGEGTMPDVLPDTAGTATADLVLKELSTFGYYHVIVTATVETKTATASSGVVVVQPAEGVLDPKATFGLAVPAGTLSPDVVEICRRLGVGHLLLDWADTRHVTNLAAVSPQIPPEFNWTPRDLELDGLLKAGLVPMGIVPFDVPQRRPDPGLLGTIATEAVQHYAQAIRDWQLGRSPALGGDSPADAVAAYRTTVAGLLEAVRRSTSPVSVWVAASPDILADVLADGTTLAGANGVSLYIEADATAMNLRNGAYRRSLDYGLQLARRAGVKRVVVGQTGEDPGAASPQQLAWKLVTRHVLSLAAGAERVYVGYGRGVPMPLPSAAAYAWMTHLLGGATYQGEIWEDVPLLEAHLFVAPERRVAVVWSWVGEDPASPDRGALVFENGAGLEARDVVGHTVGIWKNARLIVPMGEAPIFIISSELNAGELRDRVRQARIFGIPPATIWLRNLAPGNSPGRMVATLWVQSHRPYRLDAMAGLLPPFGWRARDAKQKFGLDAGQAREVTFELDMPTVAAPPKDAPPPAETPAAVGPPYEMQIAVSLGEEWVRRTQAVWPTVIPQRTIEVGYALTGWEGIEPVTVQNAAGNVRAEVRTAWDEKFFYFSAVVHRERDTFRGGRYATDGDALQLAWGLADRADDDFGQRGRDRGFPRGAFRDTDHLMAITFTKEGAQLIRLRGPKTPLRDHLPGNQDPWYGPVEGATADISRETSEKATYYAAAIPLKALAPLKGERGRALRFGFRIGDPGNPPIEWSAAAAVPDYLAGPGSYLPMTYIDGLPCQTIWTTIGPVPGQKVEEKKADAKKAEEKKADAK
jgi:hypothetical protein